MPVHRIQYLSFVWFLFESNIVFKFKFILPLHVDGLKFQFCFGIWEPLSTQTTFSFPFTAYPRKQENEHSDPWLLLSVHKISPFSGGLRKINCYNLPLVAVTSNFLFYLRFLLPEFFTRLSMTYWNLSRPDHFSFDAYLALRSGRAGFNQFCLIRGRHKKSSFTNEGAYRFVFIAIGAIDLQFFLSVFQFGADLGCVSVRAKTGQYSHTTTGKIDFHWLVIRSIWDTCGKTIYILL